MAITNKQRDWLKQNAQWDEFKSIRDENKLLPKVTAAEANADALYQCTGGIQGSPIPGRTEVPVATTLTEQFGDIAADSALANIQWVGQHVVLKDVKDEDAPNTTALGMLRRIQESPAAKDDFWIKVYTKLVPSQKFQDAQARFQDDGRELIALNAEIRKALTRKAVAPA